MNNSKGHTDPRKESVRDYSARLSLNIKSFRCFPNVSACMCVCVCARVCVDGFSGDTLVCSGADGGKSSDTIVSYVVVLTCLPADV